MLRGLEMEQSGRFKYFVSAWID